ncbi:sensor histidine kinase [Blastococcus sp. VKM Ac-2987]|uniref:sensor histidine kinase n=1 Tax=Blastococcus sp. VKM Ac-2987 TaxID=3004141 RepID=UPI0022AB9778|nr:sensor histidine kinase [Blastococcus sp. VKM Ac-2987]MCZ2858678.1 sensor histidine kinase [Blastococcus sp. VKM Ac-2987]
MSLRDRLWPGVTTRGVWLELHVAGTCAALVAFEVAAIDPGSLGSLLLVLTGVAFGVLLLVLRRRAPLVPFALGAALSAIDISTGALVAAYAVARYVSSWRTLAVAGTVGSLAALQPWEHQTPDEWVGGIATAALLVVLPGALGVWQRTRAELITALRSRAESAEAERELLARDAVLTERTRIAREMHDAVGHRVSLMVLQAGAIEMAAADAGRVEQLAGNVQAAGRQALDELRQMVGVLRGGEIDDEAPLGPQPGLADLPGLVAQARAAGMDVRLPAVPAVPVGPATSRAAYRIVQEALTNAGRHAPGARVTVTIHRGRDELTVQVLNGPARGVPAGTPGGGYGLVGLSERVRTLGGRLTAGPRLDGGFCVEAVLPS